MAISLKSFYILKYYIYPDHVTVWVGLLIGIIASCFDRSAGLSSVDSTRFKFNSGEGSSHLITVDLHYTFSYNCSLE